MIVVVVLGLVSFVFCCYALFCVVAFCGVLFCFGCVCVVLLVCFVLY